MFKDAILRKLLTTWDNHLLRECKYQILYNAPSLTVLNLLPNVDECENFEIRTNTCWGRDELCTFFI